MSVLDRVTSGFPLSISTGLAFESLFPPREQVYDPERKVPDHIDISQYTHMWINVDTLFRNMLDASDKTSLMNTGYKETVSALIDELDTIVSLLHNEGQGIMTPVFYTCDYRHALRNIHRGFSLRDLNTPTQIWTKELRDKTMEGLKKAKANIEFFKGGIEAATGGSSLMLTHFPYDLLSRNKFTRLDLLESNTGKLKKPAQWCSKYYPIPRADMSILPFHRPLLLALGDKALIQPWPIKIRKQILGIAEKRKWTPVTTLDRVLLELRLELHPIDFAVFESGKLAL